MFGGKNISRLSSYTNWNQGKTKGGQVNLGKFIDNRQIHQSFFTAQQPKFLSYGIKVDAKLLTIYVLQKISVPQKISVIYTIFQLDRLIREF